MPSGKKVLLLKRWLNVLMKNGGSQKPTDHKKCQDMPELNEISEILKDQLYLSGCRAAGWSKLLEMGITCVVRAMSESEERILDESTHGATVLPPDVRTLYVRILDTQDSDIQRYFDQVCRFIDTQLKLGRKVLVHCGAGVSRSATLIMAYLMGYRNLNLRQAYALLREKRRIVRPNNGFFRQLIEFEMRTRQDGRSTVRMVQISNGSSVPDIVYENALMAKLR